MKFTINPKISFTLRLFLGTVYIVSAFLKLFPIEYFELNIVETGFFQWSYTPVIARLIIGFEILLGVFIVFRVYIKLTTILSILTLVGFSLYLLYLILLKPLAADCGCMGLNVSMTPAQSLIKNIVLILMSIIILLHHKSEFAINGRTTLNKIISVILLSVAMALPFIVYPLGAYAQQPSDIATINLKSYNFSTDNSKEKIKIQDGKKIICFFSLGCKFCKLSSRKLQTYLEKNKTVFPLYLVFYGDSSSVADIHKFQKETSLIHAPFTIMRADSFFQAGGNALPAIFSVQNDSVIRKANFLTLNEEDILGFFK